MKTVFGGKCSKVGVVISRRKVHTKSSSEGLMSLNPTCTLGWLSPSPHKHIFRPISCLGDLELTTPRIWRQPPKTVFTRRVEFRDIGADFPLRVTFLLFVLFQNSQKYDNSTSFLFRLVLTDLCYNEFDF